MADVVMPQFVPCTFDARGWAPCKKPSTNGFCSKHEKSTCVSCGKQAIRSCDVGIGGLCCGCSLCKTCQHSLEGGSHVTKEIYDAQSKEEVEFRQTGKESKRMLALRGVPTDIELPCHLGELLKGNQDGFSLKICYYLEIVHDLMGTFPAIVKDTKIVIISSDRESMIRVWKSLRPKRSKMFADTWLVNEQIGVGYQMCSNAFDQTRSRPHKLFTRADIDEYFAQDKNPFKWAPGLIGAEVSEQHFKMLIQQASAT